MNFAVCNLLMRRVIAIWLRLIKCREYIFNFLENPAIPPDNNASERGLRKVKIKMKNSGTFRSDRGADAFLDILSIVETAKKHNQSTYGAVRALF